MFKNVPLALKKVLAEQKGFISTDALTNLFVAIFVGSILLPIALTEWFGVDDATWDAGTIAIWAIVPTMVLVAIIIRVIKAKGK